MGWLEGKYIVIIGGTSGIGLSAACACVREGARVVVVGRKQSQVDETLQQLKERARGFSGDAGEEGVAEKAIDLCVREFGSFDGLYHVAGGSGRKLGDGPLHDMTVDAWNQTLHLNLTSLMLSNRAAIRQFIALGKGGSILNISSVLSYSPSPQHFITHAYAAAKSAVHGFTRSLAATYATQNIRVNTLTPALIETPMSQRAAGDEQIQHFIKTKQPLDGGRMGLPQDLDGAAVYFLSDASRFTTGQMLTIDGGWDLSEGQYR